MKLNVKSLSPKGLEGWAPRLPWAGVVLIGLAGACLAIANGVGSEALAVQLRRTSPWFVIAGIALMAAGMFQRRVRSSLLLSTTYHLLLLSAAPMAALLAGVHYIYRIEAWSRESDKIQTQIAHARAVIPLEEALRSAAHHATLHSDLDWVEQYDESLSKLSSGIRLLVEDDLPPDLRPAALKMEWALTSRIRDDRRSFALIEAGRIDAAKDVFAAPPYRESKEAFQVYGGLIIEGLVQRHAAAKAKMDEAISFAMMLLIATGGAMLVIGLVVAARFYRAFGVSHSHLAGKLGAALDEWFAAKPAMPKGDEIRQLGEWLDALTEKFQQINAGQRSEIDQLQNAYAAAEELSRIKGDFLERTNRELRSPLNGVAGMAGLLCETHLSDEQRLYTKDLQRSADQLISVLDQIADFSRLESGRLKIEHIGFDLRLLVEDVVGRMRMHAEAKGLDMSLFIDEAAPSLLKGDPGRLRQVLGNLLDNAVKFTSAGDVSARVAVVTETDRHVTLRFSIEDTGIGIDAERQQTLFDELSQAALSHTRVAGVSGIGLTVCRHFVRLMGGQISVKSEPGKGSRFEFSAVFEKQMQTDTSRNLAQRSKIYGRVFVVSANANRRQRFEQMRKHLDLELSIYASCTAALESLARTSPERKYDFGMVDELESEDDMAMFFTEARRIPGLEKTPIIFLAMAGRRGDAEYARGLGCTGYLTGEVSPGMISAVRRALLRRDPEDEGHSEFITRHYLAEYRRRTARILVAEDDPVNQRLALTVLRKAGLRADAVDNGRAALSAVQSRRYDLVLMDCMMPEMDGFAATIAIRRREEKGRRLPILALTSITEMSDRVRCREAGMDDFIAKPIVPQTLLSAVDHWILEGSSEEDEYVEGLAAKGPEPVSVSPGSSEDTIRSFLEEGSKQMNALRRAMHARRASALERASGSLKKACSELGVQSLEKLLEEIEACACRENLDAVEGLLAEAESEFKRAQEALEAKLSSGSEEAP